MAGYQDYLAVELSWDHILDPDPLAQKAPNRLRAWIASPR
jgi:hypothetical protein